MLYDLNGYINYLSVTGAEAKTIRNYRHSVKACNIKEVDTDNLSGVWKSLVDKLDAGVAPSAVSIMFALIKAALRAKNVPRSTVFPWFEDSNYNLLDEKLKKKRHVPEAFTESEVRKLLKAAWSQSLSEGLSLYRLCILMVYSGLHVSSAKGVKFSYFKLIESAGTYVYPVHSKGRFYHAAISAKALEYLKSSNHKEYDLVVYQKPYAKTKFDVNFRINMSRAIRDKGLQHMMKNKNVFESMRKFAILQMSAAGLPDEDVRLLIGLKPKSMAYKYWVNAKGEKLPLELEKRAAEAYARTPLNRMELWK
jgi:integrase